MVRRLTKSRHHLSATALIWLLVLLGWMAGASAALAGPIVYNKPNLLGGVDAWLINPDGSGDQRIPVNLVTAEVPIWSRDGQLIAATGEVPNAGDLATLNVFLFDSTGGNLQKVTSLVVQRDPTTGEITELFEPFFKAFSPDGQRLVVVLFERVLSAVVLTAWGRVGAAWDLMAVVGGGAANLCCWGVDWSPTENLLIVPVETVDASGFGVRPLFAVPPVGDVLGFCQLPLPPCRQLT